MSDKKEILFSIKELISIEDFASRNPQFRDPMLMNLTKYPVDIMKVSPIQGLIFAKGNEHTGFNHIYQRHERWTSKPKWIESKDKHGNIEIRLQNQGVFREDSIPFFDYCNIADSVYKKENLNTEKNKRPELFEMYSGVFTHRDGKTAQYNLIVYKDTKVVHTLYPQSNKNNPKRVKGFKFTRGSISGSWDIMNSVSMIKIPYLNHEKTVKYVLIFRRVLHQNIEKAIIQVNDKTGKPFKSVILGKRNVDFKNHVDGLNQMELMRLQYADLRELEKKILKLEKDGFIK
ncbi:hypothetical protein EYV94_28355 [Puteibacter caeruleilacunae]|nr:hypothetical protein EYV94_28355 [Puteibacter caeruleilacunae]